MSEETSPLSIALEANRSEGRAGEVVVYRVTARNTGSTELSSVRINCGSGLESTTYLAPGEELHLDGSLTIKNNTRLLAGVQAADGRGRIHTNNTSTPIWLISPSLALTLTAPKQAHRGERIALSIRIENLGERDLSGILLRLGSDEMGRIDLLTSKTSTTLQREIVMLEGIDEILSALAHDPDKGEVYASASLHLPLFTSSLQIKSSSTEVSIYPGEPVSVTWTLRNPGEEPLHNVTIEGDGGRHILSDLPAGESMQMEAVYIKNSSEWINVTARGFDDNGFVVEDQAGLLLRSVSPEITIKAMPSELQLTPLEDASVNVLVSNSGDDPLEGVVLKMNGSTIASIGRLASGEFRVIDARARISGNCSLHFEASGRDSLGRARSQSSVVGVTCLTKALRIFASASPQVVSPGGRCLITCTIANTGTLPVSDIFVIGKSLGPLGNIDSLSPKRQMTVTAEAVVDRAIDDEITVEGFTQDRSSVRSSCRLFIGLKSPQAQPPSALKAQQSSQAEADMNLNTNTSINMDMNMTSAEIRFGDMSLPFNLPVQEEAEAEASGVMAGDVDASARAQNNQILDGIADLLAYVEKLLGLDDEEAAQKSSGENASTAADSALSGASPGSGDSHSGQGDYELSIEGVKGSEHGAISILDVNALPSQPAAGEPVKVTVHIESDSGVRGASIRYGLSEIPITKEDMQDVDRLYDCALVLESGTVQDGYWSGSIPGRGAGTYMPLSILISDGMSSIEGGPYLIHWSWVNSAEPEKKSVTTSGNGMLFIESSSVRGRGEVSIKDTIQGSNMEVNEKVMANGSISLETMRCIDRSGPLDNFTEKKDLVFTNGSIKGHKTVSSPAFHGGMGASVTERFNLSHVDKSETSSVKSESFSNNTLSYKTDQAFDGTWNIQTKYAKFFKKIKADQRYTGSFQTQKDIEFSDAGQN